MAGPKVTTLLTPNPASGTWQPTDLTTEATLASGTAAAGTYCLRLDMGATGGSADGDIIQMTVYTYAGGTTERIARRYSILGGGPALGTADPKIYVSEPFPTADDYKVTLLLVAGGVSSRSFPWDVINLNGV